MSGGAWGYQASEIQEEGVKVHAALRVLGQIEHELDWGVSCDTCHECAGRRVVAALEQFFEERRLDFEAAENILVDRRNPEYMCDADKARVAARG